MAGTERKKETDTMKRLKIFTIFQVMLFFLFAGQSIAYAQPQEKEVEFSAVNAYEHARYLSVKIGPRPAGSKGEQKAAQYIRYVLEQAGWKVKEQPFSKVIVQNDPLNPENRIKIINSQNIIAELPGQIPETVLLGAHYDSVDSSAPGALDNASGVGVLLELAKTLGNKSHHETYQLIFFGAEEAGLVGSEYYVSQADLSAIRWMINLDMVGTPLEIDIAGKTSAPPELVKQVVKVVNQEGVPFHLSRDFLVMTRDGTQGGNSDFSPFLDHGIPAIGLGISGRPEGFFHRPEDQIDKVSLQDIDQVGLLIINLIKSVRVSSAGPQTWDSSYLTFQPGSHAFILPTLGLRLLFIIVFFFTGYLFVRIFINKVRVNTKNIGYYLLGILSFAGLSVAAVALSGIGEILYQKIKGTEILWFAYPGLFLVLRFLIGISLILLAMLFIKKMPLPRSGNFYWVAPTGSLMLLTTFLALYRLDIAFPFLFWLLCIDLLYFWPNILLVLIAPYFIFHIHWELLNSHQWSSFYEVLHLYPLQSTLVYAGLLLPILFSGMYVAIKRPKHITLILKMIKIPAMLIVALSLMLMGFIPSYTRDYPQTVRVQKEWTGNQTAQYHIASHDFIPKDITKGFNQSPSKNIFLPAQADKPPMSLEGVVLNKGSRSFNISLKMNYIREPYRVQIKLTSSQPFRIIQMDDFLPISKLPRKIKLEGKENKGQYELILERTPPQKPLLQWSIEGESTIQVTTEISFPDLKPNLTIEKPNLSVDYLEIYRSEFQF